MKSAILSLCLSLASVAGFAKTWTGLGGDALASNANNWSPSGAIAPGDDIVFNDVGAAYPCTWDVDVALGSWTQTVDYNNVVTITTVYNSAGFDCLEIAGDVTLNGGSWTNKANSGTSRTYRLKASVGGNMTIGDGARVSADRAGYTSKLTVNGKKSTYGGNHGGYGGGSSDQISAPEGYLYGSITSPEEPGDSGHTTYCKGGGGGAVWLAVSGALTNNGAISADGSPAAWYTSAGGSVCVIAGSISGKGMITAKGGACSNWGGGGGGRVAVKLTGQGSDFANYDIVTRCSAAYGGGSRYLSSCGTIYAETAADTPGQGWLVMKGYGHIPEIKYRYGCPFAYDVSSLAFSCITITNNAYLRIPVGCTLDIRGTTATSPGGSATVKNRIFVDGGMLLTDTGASATVNIGCGVEFPSATSLDIGNLRVTNGGYLVFPVESTLTGDLEILSGGTMSLNSKLTVDGDMAIRSGGLVTSPGPNPTYKAETAVTSNLTIDAGGEYNVDGKGYASATGPTSPGTSDGGSHGGQAYNGISASADSTVKPYGSIYNPVTPGAGGGRDTGGYGGGVAVISVGKAFVNNGLVSANAVKRNYMDGAGGSVNVTAGSLSGSGTFRANGAIPQYDGAWAQPGGGRVAVTLTAPAADFSQWTGAITAYGGHGTNASYTVCGGAGTVYLRKGGEAQDQGTLIIDNGVGKIFSKWNVTPVGGNVDGTAFGNVLIRNYAKLKLEDNSTLTVSGVFSNGCQFASSVSGTVRIAGAGDAAVYGNNTFATLVIEGSGKKVSFESGKVQAVTTLLQIAGEEGSRLEIASTERGAPWTLDASAAEVSVTEADFRDTTSVAALEVLNGSDLGGCSDNITFREVVSGEEILWTGSVSSSWAEPGNWDKARAPITGDKVTIPAGCANMPVLGAVTQVAELHLDPGASLACGVYDLAVTGAAEIGGTLTASSGQALAFGGDTTVAGALNLPYGSLTLNAASAQSFTCNGSLFGTVTVAGTAVAFSNALNCAKLVIGNGASACDVTFAPGMTVTAGEFEVSGDTAEKNVVLRSSGEGAWNLVVCGATVSGATVSGSDASGGVMIFPSDCTDGGGNVDWAFTDTRLSFTGAESADFGVNGNWQGGIAPGTASDVLVAGAVSAVVTNATAVRNVTVGDGATLVINAAFAVGGSLVVENGGTVEWNVSGTISNNLSVLSGGILTHAANTTGELYKVDLAIGGNGFVAAAGKIDARGKGYARGEGPGHGDLDGSSHGGRGSKGLYACVGSYLFPTNIGSGAATGHATHDSQTGGGAVKLIFTGTFDMNGTLDVSGSAYTAEQFTYYSGAGGSILVRTAKLTGTGTFLANGGEAKYGWNGGGGRMAFHLTGAGATHADFAGAVECRGGYSLSGGTISGAPGTVYCGTAADGAGCGVITIAYTSNFGFTHENESTDYPSPANPQETAKARLTAGNSCIINLVSDARVGDITLTGNGKLKLNGHKLRVNARKHDISPNDATQIVYGEGGEIIWKIDGLKLFLR